MDIDQLLAAAEVGRGAELGVVHAAEACNRRITVLLGEPGAGKTTELRGFEQESKDRGEVVQRVNLRRCNEEKLTKEIQEGQAVSGSRRAGNMQSWLILDGVDETPMRATEVAAVLGEELPGLPEDVHVVIACRTAAWWGGLESALSATAADLEVFELLPLLRDQIETLARSANCEPDRFCQALAESGVEPLARTPMLAKLLLGEFVRSGQKALPPSRSDLFDRTCQKLATEPDQIRAQPSGALQSDEILPIAGHLAVLALLGGVDAFWTGDPAETPQGMLPVSECAAGQAARWSSGGDQIGLSRTVVRQALATALFTGQGQGGAWFAHQMVAEYLAARHLFESGLTVEKIRSLIGENAGLVAPQVQAVAAWLVALAPNTFGELLEGDPVAFVQTGAAVADPNFREVVAEGLFELAKRHQLTHIYDLRLSDLKHPSLAEQTRNVLRDRQATFDARLLAVRVARENNLHDLADDLAAIALDDSEDVDLRSSAGSAALDIDANTAATIARLVSGGDTDPAQDPEDGLFGLGLIAALRDGRSVPELLGLLRPPRNRSLFGNYAAFIRFEMPDTVAKPTIPVTHLAEAVKWVHNLEHQDTDNAFLDQTEELRDQIIVAAATRAAESAHLGRAATEVIVDRLERQHQVLLERQTQKQVTSIQRRSLVTAALAQPLPTEVEGFAPWLLARELLRSDDLEWLTGQAETSIREMKHTWAKCASYVFDRSDDKHIALSESSEVDPKFAAIAFAPKPEPVKDGQPPPGPTAEQLRDRLLEILQADDDHGFAAFCRVLQFEPGASSAAGSIPLDVTELPGWALLTDDDLPQVLRLAVRYVASPHVDAHAHFGTGTRSWSVMSGVRALALVVRTADPQSELSQEVWVRWTPALVDSHSDGELLTAVLNAARSHANDEFVEALLTLSRDEQHHGWLTLQRVRPALDQTDVSWLAELAKDPSAPGATRAEAIRQVFALDPTQGSSYLAETLLQTSDGAAKALLVAAAMTEDPRTVWPQVRPVLLSNTPFAEQVLLKLSDGRQFRHEKLHEQDVISLWELMTQVFPPDADPQVEGGFHFVSPREGAAHLRDALITALAERGTDAAVTVLTNLASLRDNAALTRLTAYARRRAARNRWKPRDPHDLARLLSNTDKFLVTSSRDLLERVIEVVSEIQRQLAKVSPPEATMLWYHDDACKSATVPGRGCRARPEDDISDHVVRRARELLPRTVINRETQVRRLSSKGVGQRTDILVEVPGADAMSDPPKVVIEVKGCWNGEVLTALKDQLVTRYLPYLSGSAGLYLVAWFNPAHWSDPATRSWANKPKQSRYEALVDELQEQADAANTEEAPIRSYVLDCSMPT